MEIGSQGYVFGRYIFGLALWSTHGNAHEVGVGPPVRSDDDRVRAEDAEDMVREIYSAHSRESDRFGLDAELYSVCVGGFCAHDQAQIVEALREAFRMHADEGVLVEVREGATAEEISDE
jgi:hypothetical protein